MKRILVVEDNKDIVKLLKLFLSKHFQVMVAMDGSEGLELFKKHEFDMIITDYLMPRVNGLNFMVEVAAAGYQGEVIVSSSHLSSEVEQKFRELRVEHFFKKPYIISELLEFIHHIFNKR